MEDEEGMEAHSEDKPLELTPAEIARCKGEPCEDDKLPAGEVNESDEGDEDDDDVVQPTDSADDAEGDDEQDAESSSGGDPLDWADTYTRDMAKAAGIGESELAALGNHRALAAAIKLAAKRDPQPEPEEEAEYVDEPIVNGEINVEYYRRNEYDPAQIALAEELHKQKKDRKEIEDRLAWYEEQYASSEFRNYANSIHDALDAHRPDFYGKSVDAAGNYADLPADAGNRRSKLYNKMVVLQRAYQEEGQKVPDLKSLIIEAEQLAFRGELPPAGKSKANDKASRVKKLAEQSKRRRPVASTSSSHYAPDGDATTTKNIANHPDIVAWWREHAEE